MDLYQKRHEQAMARWTLAGSLGIVTGPLALALALWLTIGWRALFIIFAGLAFILTWLISRQNFKKEDSTTSPKGLKSAFVRALKLARQQKVLR